MEPQPYLAMADNDEEEKADRGDDVEKTEEEEEDDDTADESASDDAGDVSDADDDTEESEGDNESDGADETEEEDESEVDASGDDQSDDDADAVARRSQFIPRSRFDQVNQRLKDAEAERQLLAKKLAETNKDAAGNDPALDLLKQIKDTRRKMLNAVSDNDMDLANELMDKLDSLNEQKIEAKLAEQTQRSSIETRNDIEYELYVQQVIKELPVFNDEGEQYDETLTADIMTLQGKMERAGDSPVAALEHALHYFRDEIDDSMEQAGFNTSKNKAGLRQSRGKQEEVRSKRKSGAASRAKKAEDSQPRQSKGAAADSKDELDFPSILSLADEEWDQIPQKRKSAARGDIVN
jgi:hypothetical protein